VDSVCGCCHLQQPSKALTVNDHPLGLRHARCRQSWGSLAWP
jgi:hypothetical protein